MNEKSNANQKKMNPKTQELRNDEKLRGKRKKNQLRNVESRIKCALIPC